MAVIFLSIATTIAFPFTSSSFSLLHYNCQASKATSKYARLFYFGQYFYHFRRCSERVYDFSQVNIDRTIDMGGISASISVLIYE